jgi:hypothetical protein
MSVQTKHPIGALTGVDLGAGAWIRQARAKRARAAYEPEVTEELARLARRISWVNRKAARLPKGSNHAKKLSAEAADCQVLSALLPQALAGKQVQKLQAGAQHPTITRAIVLLNELAGIR